MQVTDYFNFVAALALVLALILGLAWAVKRFGLGGAMTRSLPAGGGRRLAVIEVLTLDARRKMVLVKQDDRQHLLLLSANSDLVIESGAARETQGTSA